VRHTSRGCMRRQRPARRAQRRLARIAGVVDAAKDHARRRIRIADTDRHRGSVAGIPVVPALTGVRTVVESLGVEWTIRLSCSWGPRSDVPGRAGVGESARVGDRGAADLPDGDGTVGVLEENVGAVVFVVVAGTHDMPARPGIGDVAAADHCGPVHLPDRHRAVIVLPQDVGWPSLLKSPLATACQLGSGLPMMVAAMVLVPSISQIAAAPLEFCHSRSEKPSPLKSLLGCSVGSAALAIAMYDGLSSPEISLASTVAPEVVYSPIHPGPRLPSLVALAFATNRSDPDTAMPSGKLNPEISEAFTVAPAVVYSPTVSVPKLVTKISVAMALSVISVPPLPSGARSNESPV